MKAWQDLTGQKFNKLTVLNEVSRNKHNQRQWLCKCDCGNTTIVTSGHLLDNHSKSCGCLRKTMSLKHGLYNSRLYTIWCNMRYRCYDPKRKHYEHYGGRGIKVCSEWLDIENGFINFYNWSIENGYKDNLTLDRIHNDGDYEPSNCKWSTQQEQTNNKRNNHYITYNNRTQTSSNWAREFGMEPGTLCTRLLRGWTIERALTTPVRKKNQK